MFCCAVAVYTEAALVNLGVKYSPGVEFIRAILYIHLLLLRIGVIIINTLINNIAHRKHYRAYPINKFFISLDRSTLLRFFTITYVRPY